MPVRDAITHEQARAISAAVSRVPGVAALTRGSHGHVALLFPGGRVVGLRLVDADELEVHVIVDLSALPGSTDLHQFSGRIRAAASAHTGLPVSVIIADAVCPAPPPTDISSRSSS